MTDLAPLATKAKAWPFEQARAILKRRDQMAKAGRGGTGPVVFETGYGPSGLPHIGTFGEVVRTTMVRQAFIALTKGEIETRLICVSDDMDGMRKVPPTVPNPESLEPYLQMPLTKVPDPFGTHESYGHHMNARLRAFLDGFGFEYEFASATELYQNGTYDPMLRKALENYDKIMDVMLPTLGEERRATYSPFLPISPDTGRVLYVPMKATDPEAGTVTFDDEDGSEVTLPVTGGAVKLQWKPDFGMRWAALDVDFEMFGKDHQDNAPIYSKICSILGNRPPQQYVYELFLDENGEKISKSKGNGISVEEWLKYAPPESLSLFQFQKPRAAKKLYFDVIPKAVDEYLTFLEKYPGEEPNRQVENPVWHIHNGNPPAETSPVSFALLLNLVSAANPENRDQLWGFIARYAPGASAETHPLTDRLAGYAMAYYRDFVEPTKTYRAPDEKERAAMEDLAGRLEELEAIRQAHGDYNAAMMQVPATEEDGTSTLINVSYNEDLKDPLGDCCQSLTFAVGNSHEFENLRDWFKALYEVLLGQSQGPRFGGFIALYGVKETATLIREALARG